MCLCVGAKAKIMAQIPCAIALHKTMLTHPDGLPIQLSLSHGFHHNSGCM